MAGSEYEITDENAESEFKEIKGKETDEKSMINAYKKEKEEEKDEEKKERVKNKDKIIIEVDKYRKR